MTDKKILPIVAVIALFAGFQGCATQSSANGETRSESKIEGSFSGDAPKYHGFLKLDVNKNGSATFLNVVTIHLPPTEIERLKTKLKFQDNRLCFEEKPKTIEQCLTAATQNEITVKLASDGAEVKLKRIEK